MGELLSKRLILPLENDGYTGGRSLGLASTPRLGKRDPAATEESEALGRVDGEGAVLRATSHSGDRARRQELERPHPHPRANRPEGRVEQ